MALGVPDGVLVRASTVAGAEIWFHDHPAARPDDTLALSVD